MLLVFLWASMISLFCVFFQHFCQSHFTSLFVFCLFLPCTFFSCYFAPWFKRTTVMSACFHPAVTEWRVTAYPQKLQNNSNGRKMHQEGKKEEEKKKSQCNSIFRRKFSELLLHSRSLARTHPGPSPAVKKEKQTRLGVLMKHFKNSWCGGLWRQCCQMSFIRAPD